jgi:putative ABC transport system permease protein
VPAWLNRSFAFFRNLLRTRQVEDDLDEEVRLWFDTQVERGIARGLSPDEARRVARVEFEGPEQVKQYVREERMGASFETVLQDFRYAWRVLRKSPGFTFFAVLTIALALGANAAIFSLVDGVLLKSTGYPEPERIVQIWERHPSGGRNGIAPANYIDWAQQSQSFEAMAAMSGAAMSYSGGGAPRSLRAGIVSAPFFDVFGVKAVLGRTFAKEEDQRGKEKVVVLTHRLWMNQFGGDVSLVGRTILLNGEPYSVIGVLPGSSEFDRRSEDIWVPLAFPAKVARSYHNLRAVARLKPGVSFEQAQAEMTSIAEGIAERYPAEKKGWGAAVDRYLDRLVGPQLRLSLKVLMWAVAAVLLIGCANLANLLMARATLRSREIAMRMAMGAGRGRVIRLLLAESLLLSACGAAAGFALGKALLTGLLTLLPPFFLPSESNVEMDGRVLLFLAAVTILTSIAFGLAPAIQASRGQAADALKEGGRSSSAGRGKLVARNIFVGVQVAAAFILLVGGGLLLRSFERLMSVDTGYETEGLIAAYLPMANESEAEATRLTQYINRILEEVRTVPGVREVAVATGLPLRGWGDNMPFRLADKPNERVGSGFKIVTPRYFQALGLKLLAGRFLDERDTAGSPHVVVVNESFVKRYHPNESAIGKRILVEKILPNRRGLGPDTAWEIVGVVADEKGYGLESPTDVGAYASFAQDPVVGLGLVARGAGEGSVLIKAVQQALAKVNKDQVLDRAATVTQMKMDSMMSRRLTTSLLAGFALLAMLLACAGIYGVLSFVTARRTQELGIRSAMGASQWDLIRMVIGGGALPVIAGIIVGFGGSIWLGRLIETMLFAVKPFDVPTLAAVSMLFICVALVACFAPAWRASRVDPMTALRQE